ncbi:hypothetical protein E2C01_102323 [Portunus trituberculatus]|uniref:Uncharacterized protein n=1 Tax=Portunus trituberculatus TaxID=210409 RepID=A0A5B7KMI6_PORTR|nr:hypothetical protein [Portunus trituberculatus]
MDPACRRLLSPAAITSTAPRRHELKRRLLRKLINHEAGEGWARGGPGRHLPDAISRCHYAYCRPLPPQGWLAASLLIGY